MSELALIEDNAELRAPGALETALEQARPEAKTRTAREFVPLRDQILVRRCNEFDKDESGLIHIPTSAQEKQLEGAVLKVGPGKFDVHGNFYPSQVREGDHVLFGRYVGLEIRIRGEDLLLIKENDIVGLIR